MKLWIPHRFRYQSARCIVQSETSQKKITITPGQPLPLYEWAQWPFITIPVPWSMLHAFENEKFFLTTPFLYRFFFFFLFFCNTSSDLLSPWHSVTHSDMIEVWSFWCDSGTVWRFFLSLFVLVSWAYLNLVEYHIP